MKDSSAKAVLSAIAGNGFITVLKFAAWLGSASPSMLAEAIHSLADTTNQMLLYVGIRHGRKGPSRMYPMGRGRARYVWNLISAMGIFFVGFGVTAYHGIHSLIANSNKPYGEISWESIGVLLIAFVIEGYVFLVALKVVNQEREGKSLLTFLKESDDPTTIGVLFEDGIAVLGILIALAGIYISHHLNSHIPDAIAAIFIAVLLGIMAVGLAYTNSRLLIGAAAPLADEEEIRDFIESQPSVEKVTSLATAIIGAGQIRLSIEVEFHGGYFIDRDQMGRDAERIRNGQDDPLPLLVDTAERTVRIMGNEINELEKKLRTEWPQLTTIELEVN